MKRFFIVMISLFVFGLSFVPSTYAASLNSVANRFMNKLESIVDDKTNTISQEKQMWKFIMNKIDSVIDKRKVEGDEIHPVLPVLLEKVEDKYLSFSVVAETDEEDDADEKDTGMDLSDVSSERLRVIEIVNEEREERGLEPLAVNDKLMQISQDFAHYMNDFQQCTQGGISHVEADGTGPNDRALAVGYLYETVGENIACGQRNADEVMAGWMSSKAHRDNIVDSTFKDLGVGHVNGFWVQVFGVVRTFEARD